MRGSMKWLFPTLLTLAPLTHLAAQDVPVLESGTRVRIKAHPDSSYLMGIVARVNIDTLMLLQNQGRWISQGNYSVFHPPDTLRMPFNSMIKLEMTQKQGIEDDVGTILLGSLLGPLYGLGGAYLGSLTDRDATGKDNYRYFLSGCVGWILGSAHVVYLIGAHNDGGGSFLATLGGSAIGFLGAASVVVPINGLGPLLLVAPSVGATIGFNITSEYWKPVALPLYVGILPQGGAQIGIRFDLSR